MQKERIGGGSKAGSQVGTGRLVVGKRGDGERVAGAWLRVDFRVVILGGDGGEGRKGRTSKSGHCWLRPA